MAQSGLTRQRRWVKVAMLWLVAVAALATPAAASAGTGTGGACVEAVLRGGRRRSSARTVRVPLDYDQPDGATISLARDPAAGHRARRIGSARCSSTRAGPVAPALISCARGPFLFTPEVRAALRPRLLRPARDHPQHRAALLPYDEQWEPSFPASRSRDATPRTRVDRRRPLPRQHCDQRAGAIIDHMSTANVARDLDLLRQALGDPEAQLLRRLLRHAASASTYANLFPDRFRALVVDGVLDPVAWSTGTATPHVPFSTRLRSDAGAQATLNEFFRLCDAGGPSACAFAPIGGALRRPRRQAQGRPGRRHRPRDGDSPGSTTRSSSATRSGRCTTRSTGRTSPAPWRSRGQRDADALAARSGRRRRQRSVAAPSSRSTTTSSRAASASAPTPTTPLIRAWSRPAAAADAKFGYFGRTWTWVSSLCARVARLDTDRYVGPFNTATASAGARGRQPLRPGHPLRGRADGREPAAELAPADRARLGHTSIGLSACADEATARYLIAGALPAPGTVCEQDVVPFAGPAVRAEPLRRAALRWRRGTG